MKPETMMKPRTRMLMPVNHLLTSADSRAPRTSIPVGEMEYETRTVTKSIEPDSSLGAGGCGGGVDGP